MHCATPSPSQVGWWRNAELSVISGLATPKQRQEGWCYVAGSDHDEGDDGHDDQGDDDGGGGGDNVDDSDGECWKTLKGWIQRQKR